MEKCIIIGDSNIDRFPPYHATGLQVDGFPGANLGHAEDILEHSTTRVRVEKIILAFGLNNRTQRAKDTAVKQLQRALRMCKLKFPCAQIMVPEINFSSSLPLQEKRRLTHLNSHITALDNHIPALQEDDFTTERDLVHWTPRTAQIMFEHWVCHLNLN